MEPVNIDFVIGGNVDTEGKKVEEQFDRISYSSGESRAKVKESIQLQKRVIKELESELKALEKAYAKAAPGRDKWNAQAKLTDVKKELEAEKNALKELHVELEESAAAHQGLRTQIRMVTEAMAAMEAAGKRNTPEFEALRRKAGELTNAMGDAQMQAKILAHDNGGLQGVINGVAGVSGAMSAGMGVVGLFSAENEKLAKIQTKLQSLMAITIGLQQVANTLNKDSYFRIITVNKAKQAWAKSTALLNTQLGISVGLSKALMVSGIGLIIAGIAAAVVAYKQWNEQQQEAARLQTEFIDLEKNTAKAMAKEKVEVEQLMRVAADRSKDLNVRNKAIKRLNELMPDYNGHLTREGELIVNSETALKNYLTTLYKVEKAKKLIAKIEDKDAEIESTKAAGSEKIGFAHSVWLGFLDLFSGGSSTDAAIRKKTAEWMEQIQTLGDEKEKMESELNKLLEDSNVFDALFGSSGSDKSHTSVRQNLSDKYGKEAIRFAENLAISVEQARIDVMKNGIDKQLAQAALNYQKEKQQQERQQADRLEALRKQAEEQWKAANPKLAEKVDFTTTTTYTSVDLTDDDKKAFDDLADHVRRKYEETTKQIFRERIDSYRTFAERRIDIERKFEEDAQAINKSSLDEATKKDRLSVLNKQRAKELKALADDEYKEISNSSDLLTAVFTRASDLSRTRLKDTLDRTKQLVNYLRGVSGVLPEGISEETVNRLKEQPEQIVKLYDQLAALQSEYDAKYAYPFSNLIKGFKSLKSAAETYNIALKEVDAKTRNAIEKQAELEQKQGLNYLIDGALTAADSIAQVSKKMKELAAATDDVRLSNVAEQMSALAQNFSAAAQGASSGGWIGAIVGGVTDIISQTFDAIVSTSAASTKLEQEQLDFINRYKLSLLSLKNEDYETVFGVAQIAKGAEAYKKAQDALSQYNEALSKSTRPILEYQSAVKSWGALVFTGGLAGGFGAIAGSTKELTNEAKAQLEAYQKGYSDLQSMAINTTNYSGWAKFWGKQDKYISLKDMAPQLWDSNGDIDLAAARAFLETNTCISDEQRKQIENAIALKEAYDEANAVLDEYLNSMFGSLQDDAISSIVKSIQEGTDAWSDFGDAGGKVLENLGKQLMQELFLRQRFEQLQANLKSAFSLGNEQTIAEQQMLVISDFYANIGGDLEAAKKFLESWQDKAKELGFDLFGSDSTASGIKGDVAKMTEDTGDALVGQVTAMRLNVATLLANSSNSLDTMRGMLAELHTISENTSFCRRLDRIDETLLYMKNNGIKIK